MVEVKAKVRPERFCLISITPGAKARIVVVCNTHSNLTPCATVVRRIGTDRHGSLVKNSCTNINIINMGRIVTRTLRIVVDNRSSHCGT
jgi:hypothetical protein